MEKPHIVLAHNYWQNLLQKGDIAIDATCGNGFDSLFLAKILLEKEDCGKLFCFDIQEKAIENTKLLLQKNLSENSFHHIHFFQKSHEYLSIVQENFPEKPIRLIVYNLGYLPKGDKTLTTKTDTTLKSLQSALALLSSHGAISITCYPGHEEGAKEEKALLSYLSALKKDFWEICYHQWINKKASPTLLWIKKIKT
jgi:hypothetical protein